MIKEDDEEDEEQIRLLRRLWTQLIATGCVFATKLVNTNCAEKSLTLLQNVRDLAHTEDRNLSPVRRDVIPFIHDTLGMYYYKRNKYEAGLEYVRRALRLHQNREDWIGVSKCRLHEAALLGRMRKYKKALKCLGYVISNMESGKLESSTISQAERLCMVAVCYHNIASLEIQLENFQQACIASQNARRLARLCLSFSNRWLKQFDATHRNALVAMISAREMREVFSSAEEKEYFSSLATAYYA